MYDMINIFEVFLPQLLRYPNPTDPLNGEAAALMMREPKSYDAKVKGVSYACIFEPDGLLTDGRICIEICDEGRCGRGRRR